jgi:Pregnancy-associated plasma protein-A
MRRSVFKTLAAGLCMAIGLVSAHAAGPARESTRSAAELAAQNGKLDADYGPALTINGVTFANQRAFIESGARCGVRYYSEFEKARNELASKAFFAARAAAGQSVDARPIGSVTVPVWMHVIRTGTATSQGNVPDTWITAQMQVINDAWANTAFRFVLAGTTRTTNAAWYDMAGSAAELAAKTALKRGGPETLNIYVANLSGGLLGYAYYAEDAAAVGVLDGVVLLNQSLPGGNAAPYNLGDTGTHEVGHWFGLAHTFEGGCTRTNDLVADTEPEASPAFGCPVGRNSCQVTRTGDPIRNFMDYTDDSCMNMFTAGQNVRMDQQHLQYRTPAPRMVAARSSR